MKPTNAFIQHGERIAYAIKPFAAMDGWEVQMISKDIVKSDDPVKRRAFANRLLATVTVLRGENEIPLTSEEAIDAQLGTGVLVSELVNEVLKANGLETLDVLETRVDPWSATGASMAVSFMAEAKRMIGPILEANQ